MWTSARISTTLLHGHTMPRGWHGALAALYARNFLPSRSWRMRIAGRNNGRNSRMTTRRQALGLALATAAVPSLARAQDWRPNRPIRLIVPFAPGGSNDIVGRIVAEAASQALGQPIVVENRAGAGSMIGAEFVARSAPDGHTVLINSAQAAVPAIVARVPYDTLKDFAGVAVAGFSPHVLVVTPRLAARNVQELIALLKASPGRYNMATAGIGSSVHVGVELFRSVTGVEVELVHYRGGGPAVAALVANESQFGAPTMASCLGQVRGGGVRALAVLGEQRSPALPDVPSAPEAGIPRVINEEFFPILVPAATPAPIVAALGTAFQAAIRQSAARLTELAGVAPRPGFETSAQVMAQVRAGVESYTQILRAAGVQAE
jgi:tripartite-type tricarboxylate transporter receptor subunit TctC